MAKRFHSGFLSDNGTEYDVEIWDSTFSGSSTAFVLDATGFSIGLDGDPRDLHLPIMGTRCTFVMQLETANESAINTFIGELVSAPEKQFQVKVTKGSTPSMFWFGNVLTDISRHLDTSPSAFEVIASDGVGALSKVDYNDDGTAYSGTDTLLGHVVNCLGKIGTFDTFFTTGTAITTVVNWYENSHQQTSSDDPFALTRCDHRSFYDVDEQGEYKYMSCLEVLHQCVQRFGARLYLSGGAFRIEQVSERDNVSITERYYQKDGTANSNASSNYDLTLDQASEARLGNGSFEWLPAIRKVEITFKQKNWFNQLAGAEWTSSSSSAVTLAEIDYNQGLTTIGLNINVSNQLTNANYPTGEAVFVFFKFRLKVGTKYLRRNILSVNNYGVTYTQPGWVAGASHYYFHVAVPATNIPSLLGTLPTPPAVLITTLPPLQESGSGEAQLEFHAIRRQFDGSGVGTDQLTPTWSTTNTILQVSTSGNPVLDFADWKYSATADNGGANSETITFETFINDAGPNAVNRLEVYNGTAWSDSDQWREGTSGSYTANISTFHAQQLLALRKNPVRTYRGTVRGTALAHSRLDFDSAKWILLQGTFVANFDEWRGTWAAIGKSVSDITIGTPVATGGGGAPGSTGPGGVINNPGQTGIPDQGINTGGLIGGATTNGLLSSGTVTSISTTQTLNGGAFTAGQVLTIVNPLTGYQQNVTVTADTQAGDTSISVSGYLADDFPMGSFIVSSPQNQTVQGFGASTTSATSAAQTSTWWEIYQQRWSIDNDNDEDWPIEAPNVWFEVEGLTFDGDGLQSYNATTGHTVHVTKNGELNLPGLPTGTTFDLLNIEADGNVRKQQVDGFWFEWQEQWVTQDDTNDIDWPIEAPNVVFDTDEDAGDGATAGLRLDGDGLQTWKSNSATPTTYFLANGIWEYRTDGLTGTSGSGIIVGSVSGLRTFASTSTTPKVNLTAAGAITLRSTPNVGNGSTAGWRITDTSGIQLFKNTSATATVELKPDGTIILNHGGTPTAAAGGIFQNSGVLYNANAAGTKWQPQLGHILHVNLFGWGEAWSVGTIKEFFRFTSEYTAYEVHAIGYSFGSTLGSGSGSNTIDVKFFDESAGTSSTLTTLTASSFTTNLVSITATGIDQGDAIWFDCTGVKSTPAQGCTVDIYFRLA